MIGLIFWIALSLLVFVALYLALFGRRN